MDSSEVYNQLTGVDISEQKRIWDERGKGYYGEYLLFCELYKKIPGNCKILMNLDIPVDDSKTTEIDLILIHETGLYVFEIKHYKGTIYGKDTDERWTQYFRTTKNNSFVNPIEQNRYHISAINKMYPDFPVHSIIVFTNEDCSIKVTNENSDIDICCLSDVVNVIESRFKNATKHITMTDIDIFFEQLSAFSHMKDEVTIEENEAPFTSWVQPVIDNLKSVKEEVEQEAQILRDGTELLKKQRKTDKTTGILFVCICIVLSALIVIGFKIKYDSELNKNDKELNAFIENFSQTDELGIKYSGILNSFVSVSDVMIDTPVANGVAFTARLTILDDTYGIVIKESARYVICTDDGQILEYKVFGPDLAYDKTINTLGNGYSMSGKLASVLFYGISEVSDISYIKLTDIMLVKMDSTQTVMKDNLELELYSNQ